MSRKWAKERVKLLLKRESLCCFCANCEGQCCWSGEGIPVRGWKAQERRSVGKVGAGEETPYSYHVTECPSFFPDRSTQAAAISQFLHPSVEKDACR